MYNIRKFRKERGVTQAELAKNIGVSRSTIAKYENGERTPSLSTLQKIADFLKISISEFGINLPQGSRIIDPSTFFENIPALKDIFSSTSKQSNNISKDSFLDFEDYEEDDVLTDTQIRNMLIDIITVLFNQNNIYPSFEELNTLEEEIREYILFKAHLIKIKKKQNNKKEEV